MPAAHDLQAFEPTRCGARVSGRIAATAPGVLLCVAVTLGAAGLELIERKLFGRAWLETLVLSILLGTTVRTFWTPGRRWCAGVGFSAKILLEVAVVLLGASLSAATLLQVGPALIVGTAAVVGAAIVVSYALGRGLGLPHRMATLVACGNSICGNSAIAAVAPVIGAESDDVAASIAFTAVLGVAAVLGLPWLAGALAWSGVRYGVFAGLTVYAVPQVLAATASAGASAIQIGTLVKLVRVLMLGPVCFVLALVGRGEGAGRRVDGRHLAPWFILGFLAMAAARSIGLIPTAMLAPISTLATLLTVISMAALGLGVDVRVVARAGLRVSLAVVGSLIALGAISFALIRLLRIA